MLKIGAVSYINAIPLFKPIIENPKLQDIATFTFDHPARINEKLARGVFDLALISSESYLQHKDSYQLLKGLGIGATKEVMSVCLYTRVKKEKLGGKQVAIPNSSETSIQLLKTLCKKVWEVEPDFVSFDVTTTKEDALHPYAAFLLIGDSCLLHDKIKGFQKIDLAKAWHDYTKKPFIFAVFAAKKEVYNEKKDEIDAFINLMKQSTGWDMAHRDAVIKSAEQRIKLPEEVLSRYFKVIDYALSDEHYSGLDLFETLKKM